MSLSQQVLVFPPFSTVESCSPAVPLQRTVPVNWFTFAHRMSLLSKHTFRQSGVYLSFSTFSIHTEYQSSGELLVDQAPGMNKFSKKNSLFQSTRLIDMTPISPIFRILRHDRSKIE